MQRSGTAGGCAHTAQLRLPYGVAEHGAVPSRGCGPARTRWWFAAAAHDELGRPVPAAGRVQRASVRRRVAAAPELLPAAGGVRLHGDFDWGEWSDRSVGACGNGLMNWRRALRHGPTKPAAFAAHPDAVTASRSRPHGTRTRRRHVAAVASHREELTLRWFCSGYHSLDSCVCGCEPRTSKRGFTRELGGKGGPG